MDESASAAPGVSIGPDAPVPVPTGADGQPLTQEEVVEAVQAGELPKSALTAGTAAGSGSRTGGTPTSAGTAGGSTGGGAAGAPSTGSGTAAQTGPGFSTSEIKIGISVFKAGDFGKQFGIDASFGDGEKQAQAVVDYINSKGGIAGRKVKPVYYVVDFGRAGSLQDGQFEAEACEKWTNDDRVFAAINNSMARQALLPCLAKKGVPGVHDGMPIDERRLAPYRDFYYTGVGSAALTVDRSAVVQSKVFGTRGFYKPESAAKPTVVGIIHYDDEFYRDVVQKKMIPAIKSFGVGKVVVQAAPRGATTPDSTYVARFQSEGVTHVQFLGEAAAYPLTFMPAAESQGYRPKYGLTSDQTPGVILQSTAPKEQLRNVIGVGWSPVVDVDTAHDPGFVGPNDELCVDIQKKAGQNMSERGARLTATTYCNGLFFLKQNLDKATALTPAGLASTVSGLGIGYGSPGVFNPSSYSGTKHDGGSTYRDFAFKDGAFSYTSGNKKMPA